MAATGIEEYKKLLDFFRIVGKLKVWHEIIDILSLGCMDTAASSTDHCCIICHTHDVGPFKIIKISGIPYKMAYN